MRNPPGDPADLADGGGALPVDNRDLVVGVGCADSRILKGFDATEAGVSLPDEASVLREKPGETAVVAFAFLGAA